MNLHTLKSLFNIHKEKHLFGRYITPEHLDPLIQKHRSNFKIESIGTSVLGVPIQSVTIGSGPVKILMWSQMHGNEGTTTKAIFDLLNLFSDSDSKEIVSVVDSCTIVIIPMLNPDGAKLYTRLNANQIDLNRDAQNCSQPESRALRLIFDTFKPEICFNLHGQRSIFSAGNSKHPATISFLAPAQDQACIITDNRKKAMALILKMNRNLQQSIPNQVGRYDDAFNLNCVGDTFQSFNATTLLFEAGHYHEDYDREVVRELIFQSLLIAILHVTSVPLTGVDFEAYEDIPQNEKLFFDIIIRNARVEGRICSIGIQYQEKLIDGTIQFVPIVEKIFNLNDFFGHKEVNANGAAVLTEESGAIYEGYENDFVMIKTELFSLKL